MSDAICPECGCPLSVEVTRTRKTGTIKINLFCEGFADDIYKISIDTHLSNEKLREWNKIGSTKKASMQLEKRVQDPLDPVDFQIEYERYQEK